MPQPVDMTDIEQREEQLRQLRQQVMDLISETIMAVKDDDLARHQLSVLWGRLRDLNL